MAASRRFYTPSGVKHQENWQKLMREANTITGTQKEQPTNPDVPHGDAANQETARWQELIKMANSGTSDVQKSADQETAKWQELMKAANNGSQDVEKTAPHLTVKGGWPIAG
eukprot:CAMPEP_0113667924 /NCGR_PEP_ID=MMETSP0038_2-20120614/3714_1 /TAXON_ID=2898 /ORGANISM="Cryptomonas paramecium" /LENGTH=111 /DNA_ID=CAMNT_0000583609 /DNA_START=56 /DNA_END=391 /DNA_ORIENTATION=- /assembly_acc=CAM_ASM_000170